MATSKFSAATIADMKKRPECYSLAKRIEAGVTKAPPKKPAARAARATAPDAATRRAVEQLRAQGDADRKRDLEIDARMGLSRGKPDVVPAGAQANARRIVDPNMSKSTARRILEENARR